MSNEDVKLSDICTVQSGKAWRASNFKSEPPGLPVVRIQNLGENDHAKLKYWREEYDEKYLLEDGDLLLGLSGSIKLDEWTGGRAILNQRIAKLTPKPDIYKRWFYWKIYSLVNEIEGLGKLAIVNNVSLTDLRNLELTVPPLETQKKIAAVLDKADTLRQKRRQTIHKLDELTQSVFLDMFGDPYHNQKDFPLGTIRDLVSATKYGTNKKAHEEKGEYPVIRMGNLTYSGEWDFTDMKYVDLEDKELEKYLVYKGDVLFNRTNSKELVGKTGVYRREEPIAYAGYLIRVRTNEKANSEFLSGFLNSPYGKKKLEHMCKNIVGMANINAQELQDIEIMIPPIELQERFRKKTSKIRKQRKKLEKSLEHFDLLFNSLLQKAFKGELNFGETQEQLLAAEEGQGYAV